MRDRERATQRVRQREREKKRETDRERKRERERERENEGINDYSNYCSFNSDVTSNNTNIVKTITIIKTFLKSNTAVKYCPRHKKSVK